jgi:hypothetical protein
MRLTALALAMALALVGCLAPPPASERATDAARELNVATRFGRMDIAMGRTASGVRDDFMKRRTAWGGEIRIVDVELAGLSMPDSDHALIQVDYAWVRMSEGTLRSTRIAQHWETKHGEWQLAREHREAGDLGLFGEPVKLVAPPHRDVQFATKTIREQ